MKNVFLFFSIICAFFSYICLGVFAYFYKVDLNRISVKEVNYRDNKLIVNFDNVYGDVFCAISGSENISLNKWSKINNNKCVYDIGAGSYNIYLKKNGNVVKLNSVNKLFFIDNREKYYMAVGSKVDISSDIISIGDISSFFNYTDDAIVYVKDNIMYAKSIGIAKISDDNVEVSVIVSDLINKIPDNYDYNKPFLSCGRYSKDDADFLDEVLFDRVNAAGVGTRAGVVAAARFLTLEFPYRISYFSENGRLGAHGVKKVDGEGRYYHKGLYLHKSKFAEIKYVDRGPMVWGCPMYSKPAKSMRSNGLDCSGFTTWVIYNGGYDIGDLGANSGSSSTYDLNDFGDVVRLDRNLSLSNKIKAGDLLGEVSKSDGHSAVVVGVDKNNYYVAESLWYPPLGVNINTYKKGDLYKYFETVNLMDSYYKKQGDYTAMWK